MSQYRKKPVVIEAWQWNGSERGAPGWLRIEYWENSNYDNSTALMWDDGSLTISTLEGIMRADEGDWIIQGVKGEIYPCKPDIFETTYEPVAAETAARRAAKEETP